LRSGEGLEEPMRSRDGWSSVTSLIDVNLIDVKKEISEESIYFALHPTLRRHEVNLHSPRSGWYLLQKVLSSQLDLSVLWLLICCDWITFMSDLQLPAIHNSETFGSKHLSNKQKHVVSGMYQVSGVYISNF